MLLKIGSWDLAVAVVQQRLCDLGFDITADGIFGPETESVIRSFQSQEGIGKDDKGESEMLCALGLEPDLLQKTLAAWQQLANFRPPLKIQKLIRDKGVNWYVHRIEQGHGDINLDFYPVKVNKLPVVHGKKATAAKLLSTIRRSFNQFVDSSIAAFEPYDPDDQPLWTHSNPFGAVLHIDINIPGLNVKNGAVVVANAAHTDWVFSTIWTVDDTSHPVSGARQFGYLEQTNDAHIFYTRAANRITSDALKRESERVFDTADKLWRTFQKRMAHYVNQNGGQAQVLPQATISQRHDWDTFRSELYAPRIEWLP